ncbi:MAG: alpha/beta hydrolase, partial [Gemmatimonadales bacterium]|nr:alpha/beta hydrolase [Gemmatimonadales bacterium]
MKARWLAVPLLLLVIVLQDHPEQKPRHQAEWLAAGAIELRTVRAGSGDTTLFLLHGFGESLLAYRALFDRLATRFRVVAVDLPGFGLSDKPDGPYDYQTMMGHLRSFLERHTTGPIVMVGHSMGGQLAAGLAMLHPDRVVATVLIAPAGHGLSPWHSAVTGEPADLVGWLNVPIAYLMPIHAPDWLEEPAARRAYDPLADPSYRTAATRVLKEYDFAALEGRLDSLAQPTLLIWGRLDPTIPISTGESMAAQIPCNRFLSLDRTLHRPHQTAPDTVFRAIVRFLEAPLP